MQSSSVFFVHPSVTIGVLLKRLNAVTCKVYMSLHCKLGSQEASPSENFRNCNQLLEIKSENNKKGREKSKYHFTTNKPVQCIYWLDKSNQIR